MTGLGLGLVRTRVRGPQCKEVPRGLLRFQQLETCRSVVHYGRVEIRVRYIIVVDEADHIESRSEEAIREGEGARWRKVVVAVKGLEWSC